MKIGPDVGDIDKMRISPQHLTGPLRSNAGKADPVSDMETADTV